MDIANIDRQPTPGSVGKAVDFSHLSKTTAEVLAPRLARRLPVSDEMLLEAAERVGPALLAADEMEALRKELDPNRQRRGRPAKGAPTRMDVAAKLAKLTRPDVPGAFLDALKARLVKGQGLTELERAQRAEKELDLHKRNSLMSYLYREFSLLIADGSTVEHPILGTVAVTDVKARGKRAMAMTQEVLTRHHFYPPSLPAMWNIISRKKSVPIK